MILLHLYKRRVFFLYPDESVFEDNDNNDLQINLQATSSVANSNGMDTRKNDLNRDPTFPLTTGFTNRLHYIVLGRYFHKPDVAMKMGIA